TNIWTVMTVTGFRSKWMGVIIDPLQKYGDAPRAPRRPDVPPHGAQSAPWGPRRSGATTAERGPHCASCARWGAISGIFEGGATQSAGMHRRPNAAGLSPRAARSPCGLGDRGESLSAWFAAAALRARGSR